MVARNRVVLSGNLGSPVQDQWSVGLNFALADGGAVSGVAALQTWATGIAALLDAGETDYPFLTGHMSSIGNLNRVDVYEYPDTGPAAALAGSSYAWSGTGSQEMPFSTCICITHITAISGRSYRGRTYWPYITGTISTSGTMNVGASTATEFAELLNDIAGTSPDPLTQPVVYSATKNIVTPVTQVRVGNAPDTQRRRDNGVGESFAFAPV